MDIAEIRALAPEADVYCLTPDASYLVLLNRLQVSSAAAMQLHKVLQQTGIQAAVVTVHPPIADALRLFALPKETDNG